MRLIKKVVEIGNGAAIYVPKEYRGAEVIVIVPEGIDEIKKKVLSVLIDFMPNVLGVYLYGSYARNEQTTSSDVDILVITKEKDEQIKPVLKNIGINASVATLEGVKRTIKNLPLMVVPILQESRAFLNTLLLEELQKEKIDFKKFVWNFQEIRRVLKIIKKFIELDEEEIALSHIYSLIMRARVCFMVECLIKNKDFNNKNFKKTILNYGLSEKEFDRFYSIYQKIRDEEDENIKDKIKKPEISKLIKIVEKYLKKIENETKKASGKRD